MNWWLQPSRLTVGLQITDHFLIDDAPTYVNKGNQRQMRDQSCGQRQSLVLALMINTPPPATSLAVAPEASLEAAELQHCLICSTLHRRCVRQEGEGQQAASSVPSTSARIQRTQQTHNAWEMAFYVLSQTSHRYTHQDQILSTINIHLHSKKMKGVCVWGESEKDTCRFCRLSPVKCNSNTSCPRGYFFSFPSD